MLYVFNLNSDVCQLFLNQAGGERLSHWNEPQQKPITIPHVHQWKLDKPQPQMMISRQSLCVVNLLTSFNAPRDNFRIMGFFYFASEGLLAVGSRVRAAHTSTLNEAEHSLNWQLKGTAMPIRKGALSSQLHVATTEKKVSGHGCPNLTHIQEPLIWQSKSSTKSKLSPFPFECAF